MPAIMFQVLVFPHWIELEKIEVWTMLAVLMSRRWFSRSLKFHGYEILCNVQTEQSAIHAVSISIWLAYAWYDAESLSVIKRIIIQNQKHQDNSIYWQFNNACMSYKTWSGLIFIAIFFFVCSPATFSYTLRFKALLVFMFLFYISFEFSAPGSHKSCSCVFVLLFACCFFHSLKTKEMKKDTMYS